MTDTQYYYGTVTNFRVNGPGRGFGTVLFQEIKETIQKKR